MTQNELNIEQKKLREATLSSLKKIDENLYCINYQNDYYLQELLNKGFQNQEDIKKFVSERLEIDLNFEEVSYGKSGCSSFNVYNKANQNLFGRNFDIPLKSPTIVVWTQPKDGYKSINFVHGYYLGIYDKKEMKKERLLYSVYDIIDGMNEKGLTVSILRLKDTPAIHQDDASKKNAMQSLLMKGVLDFCKNVKEATDFFQRYNLHEIGINCSYHYLFTDAKGDSILLEYFDNKPIIIKPYDVEKTKYLYATNFFLSKPIGSGNENGIDRYTKLKDKLKDDTIMESDETMKLLNDVHKETTQWSNVYNTSELNVKTALRHNYDILYEFKVDKPNEFKIVK
jgi:hypothetical protein